MALSDMQVFNQYFMPAVVETYPQMIQQFNAASGGALQLEAAGFEGDFLQESFYKEMFAAGRRVNRYGSNDDVTATQLSQAVQNAVKVAGGWGPLEYEPSQMTWLRKPTQEGVTMFAQNFSEFLLSDQLNTVLLALTAAVGANSKATVDESSADSGSILSHAGLNRADAKFGDASGSIVTRVMNGHSKHLLIGENIANANHLFVAGGVQVLDILGKRVVVTDSPALADTGKVKVLNLVAGAGVVNGSSDIITNIETKNGKQRIVTSMQADYSFGVKCKGYSWDDSKKSPTDAQIGTGSNWSQVVSSVKHTAGTMLVAKDA